MKRIQLLFVLTGILCYVPELFAQYTGSDNDGYSTNIGCVQNLNGTTGLIPGPVIGSAQFCAFATETYSLSEAGSTSSTVFTWTGPPGSTITSGQGTNSVLITFGNIDGNVSVDVSNECVSVNSFLPVTQASCTFFRGGDNDGFSSNLGCIQQLDGGPALIPSIIFGSTEFCPFATEVYSISVSGALPSAIYSWTVPPGATVTAGQGTNSVLITFGGANGTISVDISNECETVNQVLPVTAASCTFFAGGINDGFSTNVGCIQNLDGGSAFIQGPIVGSTEFCPFATEAYTITVAGATSSTIYTWTGPAGSTITSGQGTNSVLITFGGANGTISVDISNECETVNQVLPVTASSCTFFSGGSNDGFTTNVGCIQSLNGGPALIPGPIVGSTQFCFFATEAYSIVVSGATSSTIYTWSVPAGATVTSGQGTNSVLITFGGANGNVSVDVSNECETVNQVLPVTAASCTFFSGGNNDGFTTNVGCIQSLNGGSGLIPGAIVGSTQFCSFATEAYSITVAGATSSTVYTWSGPPGSAITSGQGTNTVLVTFGGANGNISVDVSNSCQTVNVLLPVTSTSCLFYRGGSNDGFSVTTTVNIPLPIQLVSFNATMESGVVNLTWITASELNNDFFQIERSQDGKEFSPIVRVEGAGTTNQRNTYHAVDESPLPGTSYYMLTQTDFDGTKSYSKVVVVHVESELSEILKFYPNPVHNGDILHFEYLSDKDEVIKISLTDPSGRSTDLKGIPVKVGWNNLSFAPELIVKGVHLIRVQTSRGEATLRLIVF